MPARLPRAPGVADGARRIETSSIHELRTVLLHFKNPPHPLLPGDGGTLSECTRWHHLPQPPIDHLVLVCQLS